MIMRLRNSSNNLLTPYLPNERSGHLQILLSNARRFYSSMAKPLDGKGLTKKGKL